MLLKNDFMRMFLFLWPQNSFRFCFSHFDMGFCPEKMGVSTSYSLWLLLSMIKLQRADKNDMA